MNDNRRFRVLGRGRGRVVLVVLVVLGLIGSGSRPTSAPAATPVQLNTELGKDFVSMEIESLLTEAGYQHLGLTQRGGAFRLEDIPGELLVLEFFSQYCLSCQRQAPHLQSFFDVVSKGDLSGRVRLLTVGLGSRAKHLMTFRRELELSYPMAPDPFFDTLMALGEPGGTPFTVFLLKREGTLILADYHLGMQGDAELLARARILVEGKAKVAQASKGQGGGPLHPPLGLTPVQQQEQVSRFLSALAGRDVRTVAVDLGEAGKVYQALGSDGTPTGLYARLISRGAVCDVCHAVHFLLAFDGSGVIRGFEPIYVTKYGNEDWSEQDVEKFFPRIQGRSLSTLTFDPEVDAVTSATMSSALIFDEARRTSKLLPQLPRRPAGSLTR